MYTSFKSHYVYVLLINTIQPLGIEVLKKKTLN